MRNRNGAAVSRQAFLLMEMCVPDARVTAIGRMCKVLRLALTLHILQNSYVRVRCDGTQEKCSYFGQIV